MPWPEELGTMETKIWCELSEGDQVYELGKRRDKNDHLKPYYYGPFEVVNINMRVLRNKDRNREFLSWPDGLYVEVAK